MRWGLDVRRLVELDLAFLGPRVIVVEYGLGVLFGLALGGFSIAYAVRNSGPAWSWPVVLGLELAAIGVNYVPLFVWARRLSGGAASIAVTRAAMRERPAEARSYGLRQAWILVPGAVVWFAATQRTRVPPANREMG